MKIRGARLAAKLELCAPVTAEALASGIELFELDRLVEEWALAWIRGGHAYPAALAVLRVSEREAGRRVTRGEWMDSPGAVQFHTDRLRELRERIAAAYATGRIAAQRLRADGLERLPGDLPLLDDSEPGA